MITITQKSDELRQVHQQAFNDANSLASKFFNDEPYSRTNYLILINALAALDNVNDSKLNSESLIKRWYEIYAITHKFLFWCVPGLDISISTEKNSTGGLVVLNDNFKDFWVNDVTEVAIINAYPTTLFHIFDETKMKCSITGFGEVYETILTLRPTVKKIKHEMQSQLSLEQIKLLDTLSLNLKLFINATFGFLSSSSSLLKIEHVNASVIAKKVNMALTKITKEFAGHWIYADTDAIYFYNFKEIESRFKEFIRTNRLTANYNFDYETDKSGMFIGRKKYIIKDIKTGAITLKGIRLK